MGEDRRLVRLTKVCLALPESSRELAGRHARFHVRDKTFAWYLDDHHGDGIVSVSCKMALDENREVAALDPARFYLPAYMAHRGWIALRLDAGKIDWSEVAELVAGSYRLVAPKRLAALVSRRES
ncbi:MAG TPA: MmcQ/YjbR family DNA-binding protein [Vicinamibacteria bacterium]|nr:MmcQ/YjbR family DNA-binding protein [Vicinamibacteria bacterium]